MRDTEEHVSLVDVDTDEQEQDNRADALGAQLHNRPEEPDGELGQPDEEDEEDENPLEVEEETVEERPGPTAERPSTINSLQERSQSVSTISSWDIDSFLAIQRGMSVNSSSHSTVSMGEPDKAAQDLKKLAKKDPKAAASIRSAVDLRKVYDNTIRKNKSN